MIIALTSCNSSEKIKVGSKDFSENIIVAELYSLALEDAGYSVDRNYSLSGEAAHTAIISDEIDIYPEYTGTGLCHELGEPEVYDKDEVYTKAKAGYKEKWNIDWLEQSNINDATCYIMRKDVADELGIKTMSDAQAKSSQLVFGYHADTPDRASYKLMFKTYGDFNWGKMVQIEGSVQYEALDKGEINFTEALTTDPHLSTGEYVVITEDVPFTVPFYLTPIVRGDVLSDNPDIEKALNKVSAALDNDIIIELVKRVDIDKEEAEDVAKDFYENNIK